MNNFQSVLVRLLGFLGAVAVVVLAFFFLAAALIAGAVLAAVVFARIWWVSRKLKKAADQEVIITEYTVVEREALPRLPEEPASEPIDRTPTRE